MENEEIKNLMHRKAYEDKFMAFLRFKFWHPLIILSLFHSLGLFLEHSNFGSRKEKKETGNEGKQGSKKEKRMKKLQREYLQVTFYMCYFLAGLDMHGFSCCCMVLFLSVA